jgi:uncharacterized protein (DUF934 family)
MPLLKNNALIEDTWTHLGADEPALPQDDVIVPYARLLKEFEQLSRRTGKLGVSLANVERAESLSVFLPRLSVIVLTFPSFSDGRAYSIARQLREFGYRGELRAAGNVLPDQLQFMLQVGFDTFEITDRFPLAMWQSASNQMSLAYQRGLFHRGSEAEVWTERHTDADAWLEQPHAG